MFSNFRKPTLHVTPHDLLELLRTCDPLTRSLKHNSIRDPFKERTKAKWGKTGRLANSSLRQEAHGNK